MPERIGGRVVHYATARGANALRWTHDSERPRDRSELAAHRAIARPKLAGHRVIARRGSNCTVAPRRNLSKVHGRGVEPLRLAAAEPKHAPRPTKHPIRLVTEAPRLLRRAR